MNKLYSGLRSNPVNQYDNYSNYKSVTYTFNGNVISEINKKDPQYTAPTAKEDLVYTGLEQILINAGSTNDGTIKYSLDGTNWGTSVPTGTEAQTYTVYWKLEGDTNHNDVAQASISVEIAGVQPTGDFVDLGLPSGKLWSDRNIGAAAPEAAGLYFAWGETEGYKDAEARNAALGLTEGFDSTAYTATGASAISANLTDSHDAAVQNFGNGWRMPTKAEIEELYGNTNHEWTTVNGVAGRKFTNKNDSSKYIFIPSVGYYYGTTLGNGGTGGFCWSSTYVGGTSKAYLLRFYSSDVSTSYYDRFIGVPIRPIITPQPNLVDLDLPSGTKWADRNLGASSEEDYGEYYSWGNIEGHKSTNGSTFDDSYNFGTSNSGPYASTPGASIQFTSDTKNADYSATSGYDAARENLGGSWRMPTATEFQELYDNTDNEWTTINGVYGRKFMKKSDHSVYIFFPAAGRGSGTSLSGRGSNGSYWSSSLNSAGGGYYLRFSSSGVNPQGSNDRCVGYSVRAVKDPA